MSETSTKILLVEDNDLDAVTVRKFLACAGEHEFIVVRAKTLDQTLSRLDTDRFDVVLLDLNVPDSQGIDTFRALVKQARRLPVIILTGEEDEEAGITAVRLGAQDFIRKGFLEPQSLARAVRYGVERHRLYRELQSRERMIRQVLEQNADGIVIVSEKGLIRYINRAGASLLGASAGGLIDRPFGHVLEAGPPKEMVLRCHDGGMVDVEVSVVESDWKEEPALLATLRDVTMRKENEATRIASERRNQQSQKLESLGMLSGGISHGLNNLLTVILANASMVKADTDPQSPAYQSLQHVESAAIEAADACVALLNYTGGVRPVEIARLKVNELVENHERMLEFALAKDISLHFDLNDSLPDIDGDPALLCQVLMNLAGNASEAKSDDSPTVWIRTGLANLTPADADRARWPQDIDGGEYVYLEVEDNGNGMDDETLNKIYDPFFSTRFTGRGMGMAVVMGIIRAHSGMIAIDTSPGDGTKVRVYLPPVVMTGSTVFMAREDFEDPPPAKLRRPTRDGVMLVVDDEKMICRTGAMVLGCLGFQTAEALTGEQAIEWFTKNHTDCVGVLLDYAMPGMSGDKVLTRLLEIKPDIPVIFTSGHARDAEVSTLMDLGDVVFLPKPFDIDALEQAIDQLM
ncbi:MAG: CheY-like chemotaxis protein/nitrogen-specific signal transduction histidine kinase [Limisphaerales bacterium]|jgi:CheY-like chemotaxis protein/nitrogen-specific signal transduction histidine kinase